MKIISHFTLYLYLFFISIPLLAADSDPQNPPSEPSTSLFPASQLPLDEPASKFTDELLNMVITLGMVIAVIFALAWIMKRMLNAKVQQENVTSNIKVIERRTISSKSGIYVLEIFDKILVVAESPAGFHYLTSIDVQPDRPSRFEKILEGNQQQ